jgi:hypothetical protein
LLCFRPHLHREAGAHPPKGAEGDPPKGAERSLFLGEDPEEELGPDKDLEDHMMMADPDVVLIRVKIAGPMAEDMVVGEAEAPTLGEATAPSPTIPLGEAKAPSHTLGTALGTCPCSLIRLNISGMPRCAFTVLRMLPLAVLMVAHADWQETQGMSGI